MEETIFERIGRYEESYLSRPEVVPFVTETEDGVKRFDTRKFQATRRAITALMLHDEKVLEEIPCLDKLTVKEALHSPDLTLAFPKVISDILVRPKEPTFIGQSVLAKKVPVNGKYFELTQIGAIRAQEIGDTQEYPIQYLPADRLAGSLHIRKFGVRVAISDDMINDSEWDLMGLHVEAAGNAMLRLKEENIFEFMEAHAHIVFNNASTPKTTGVNEAGTANNTMAIDDFVELFAALMANGYTPTDVISHPFFWRVMALDPDMRWIWMQQSKVAPPMGDSAAAAFPFGFQVHLTPFTNPSATDTSPFKIHVYVVDRNDPILILQKQEPTTEEWADPARDIQNMKVAERYGLGIGNAGRSMAVAKDVETATNYGTGAWSRGSGTGQAHSA